jgi:hypothetical protein
MVLVHGIGALGCLLFETPVSNFLVLLDYFRCEPRWYMTELPVTMSSRTEGHIAEVTAPILVCGDPVTRWHPRNGAGNSSRLPRPANS